MFDKLKGCSTACKGRRLPLRTLHSDKPAFKSMVWMLVLLGGRGQRKKGLGRWITVAGLRLSVHIVELVKCPEQEGVGDIYLVIPVQSRR